MAIYHYQEKTLSRSQGRSACGGVSYITKQPLHDERTGQTHAYSARGHDVTVQIYTPKDAPSWTQNLQTFWNKVEAFEDLMAETRFQGHPTNSEKNARSLAAREDYKERAVTSHTAIFALPREFTRAQSQEAIKRFVDRYFMPRRLCVTAGFHWEHHNPHVHLQIAPRGLEGDSFSALKNRDLNSPQELRVRRHLIADVVNEVAKENGLTVQVDARSFKDRDIDLIPTRHEGWFAQKYLKDASRIIQENQEIQQENLKILFEKPENLLKLVMGNNSVVTRDQIEREIFQRVGGDAEMWALLSHRLTSWTKENERHNSPLFHTLSRTPSLSPYLSSYRSEGREALENAEIRGSERAERLHASLPAGMREAVSVDALQAALSQETHGSSLQNASFPDSSELSGANGNVPDVKAGAALPSEEQRLQWVHRFVDALAEQGRLDRAGDSFGEEVFTTQENRELEKRTQGALHTLSQSQAFGVSASDVEAARLWVEAGSPHALDREQREAVTVLTGSSALVSLEGPAGTGKTTVLKTVRQAYESQGYRVRGTSFQGKTAAFLGEDVGIESQTLDLFQRRWKKLDEKKEELAAFKALPVFKRGVETVKASRQQDVSPSGKRYNPQTPREKLERHLKALAPHDLTSKDVIFVDEAYLSPSSSLRSLLERASEKGAKVILVGDGYQGLTFASGDLTRQAKKYGETVSLQRIRRQQSSWQREASEKLSRHDVWGGFSMYQERGQLMTGASSQETDAALVGDWMAAVRDETGAFSSQKIQDSLILARTNEAVDRLDRQVVQALKREGALGQGFLVSRQGETLKSDLKDAEKAFKATLTPYDKVTRQTLQSAGERGTLTPELLNTILAEARPSFFSRERAISQKHHEAVQGAFRSLQGASAALFAERAENTFYEGQRVSFRSNDYSNAFNLIPPWALKDTSSALSKALVSLHQRMEKIDTRLSSLEAPEQRRVRGALLEGEAGPAQKALVKAGPSPGIFGLFHDLQKIVKTPQEVRETYHVFRQTPKGVRNGQEGTFLGVGKTPGSLRVHLEKGSVIEFVPQDLNPRSFGNKILRPAYALTYDRSQGLTRDQVFALLEESPANKLYVAGTRHRIAFKGYFNGQETQDVKQMLIRSEKSDYRPTLEDYVITEAERPFQRRVSGYLETLQKHQQILVQIMELREHPDHSAVFSSSSYRSLSDAHRTLFDAKVLEGPARQKFEEGLWADLKDLKAEQQESAREIAEDLEGHRLFLTQAGVSIKSLLVAAGLEERSLSSLEKLVFHKVSAYSAVATKTRDLWEEIATTHPGALCYGHPAYERYTALRQERDLQASALVTGEAVVGETLIGHSEALSVINEPVRLLGRVLKDPALTVTIGQMKAHHRGHLDRLSQQEAFQGFEDAHQKVVTYRQTRNLVAASFKASHPVDPALLEKRD